MPKSEALANQAIADSALYDAGFAEGVASVGGTPGITPEQEEADINAAVTAAVTPLNQLVSDLQLAKSQEDALLVSIQDTVKKLAALFP